MPRTPKAPAPEQVTAEVVVPEQVITPEMAAILQSITASNATFAAATEALDAIVIPEPTAFTTNDLAFAAIREMVKGTEQMLHRSDDVRFRVETTVGRALIARAAATLREQVKALPDKWTYRNVCDALGLTQTTTPQVLGCTYDSLNSVVELGRNYDALGATSQDNYLAIARAAIAEAQQTDPKVTFSVRNVRRVLNDKVDPNAGSNRRKGAEKVNKAVTAALTTGKVDGTVRSEMGDTLAVKFDAANELLPKVNSWADLTALTVDQLTALQTVIGKALAHVKASKPTTDPDTGKVTS